MTMAGDGRRGEGRGLEGSTEQVVGFVRNLIDRGRLRPGDRLPAERDLAVRIGVSPSVRAGLHTEAAGLAAQRATSEHLATLAEEVAGLFANRDNPYLLLVHDINVHRSVAESAKNPIVGALVGMVSALYYERRRKTAEHTSDRDLRDAAEAHRRIYQAIRARDPEGARRAMNEHLLQASRCQARDPASAGPLVSAKRRAPKAKRKRTTA